MASDTLRSHGELILKQLQSGSGKPADSTLLARFLTHIDRLGPKALGFDPLLNPETLSFRVGITGPPGAGKSTLIGALIRELRKRQRSVSVLAVDPSSPFSGGAILGDRIRFNDFLDDASVFVRSIGSRGSLGGLCGSAYLMTRAFDMAGFDISLVETVGVGQTELEIMNVADLVVVVLVPESGDSIQTMKAGLIEIADLFVVNKSDRDGAETLARELENSIELGDADEHIPVLRMVAKEGTGVPVLADHIERAMAASAWKLNRKAPARLRAEARALLRNALDEEVERATAKIRTTRDLAKALR